MADLLNGSLAHLTDSDEINVVHKLTGQTIAYGGIIAFSNSELSSYRRFS